MKTCTRCQTEKPLDDFHLLKKAKDGRQYRCKQCVAEVAAERWSAGVTYAQKLPLDERRKKRREAMQRHRALHPEKIAEGVARTKAKDPEGYKRKAVEAAVRHRTGISLAEYEARFKAQGGVCAICGQPEKIRTRGTKVNRLAVDHCHDTGDIRGLLCHNCNTGIGRLGDSIEGLERALAYLRR